jgi:hypothetical protein
MKLLCPIGEDISFGLKTHWVGISQIFFGAIVLWNILLFQVYEVLIVMFVAYFYLFSTG